MSSFDTSQSSCSSADLEPSDISTVTCQSKKNSTLLRINKHLRKDASESKKKAKRNIRKISKEDFAIKRVEFSRWCSEQKHIQIDKLSTKRRDAVFAKFVKKFNSGKLPKEYYRETDSLWVNSPPPAVVPRPARSVTSLSRAATLTVRHPSRRDSAVNECWSRRESVINSPIGADCGIAASTDSVSFGTFGKKSGARALREMCPNNAPRTLRPLSLFLMPSVNENTNSECRLGDQLEPVAMERAKSFHSSTLPRMQTRVTAHRFSESQTSF